MFLERGLAVFITFFTAILLAASFGLDYISDNGVLGEGFFPINITVILLILTVFYLWDVFFKNKVTEKPKVNSAVKRQVLYILAILVCLAFTRFLGMLICLGLFNIFILLYIEKFTIKDSIIFTLIFMLTIYLIFEKWFGLIIPKGFLGI
ncbi:MAG: tripartite tricarboxylate transporter TctB family protein [Dehalobacterium sp.]